MGTIDLRIVYPVITRCTQTCVLELDEYVHCQAIYRQIVFRLTGFLGTSTLLSNDPVSRRRFYHMTMAPEKIEPAEASSRVLDSHY
jgi:hypothetical protein